MVEILNASAMSELHYFASLPPRATRCKYSSADCSAPSRLPSLHVFNDKKRRIVACCSVSHPGNNGEDLFRASILISETMSHYRMRSVEYAEENEEVGEMNSHPSNQLDYGRGTSPFPVESRESKSTSLVIDLLKRFKTPTVFLKVSCDKDFVLPIIVEEHALRKLVQQLSGGNNDLNLDQYLLVQNVAAKIGFKATLLMITKSAVTTYIARLYLSNVDKGESFSVDIEPCDGVILANLLQIPICANRRMVYMEGIVYSSAMGRIRESKPAYDVNLDSAGDGHNSLAEELRLVRNMNLAVEEERFKDAALWRTKLVQLLKSSLK